MKISQRLFQNLLVDKVKLILKGGNGGNGNPKFRGKGGNGGNVILAGNPKSKLEDVCTTYPSYHVNARNGQEPRPRCIIGQHADDITINVPTGIEVSLKSGELLGTICKTNDKMVVCRGGLGGGPLNNYLAEVGEKVAIELNLKLIADVGMIGFPNAGKSSLLRAISGVPAKIANYPFTTLKPQVAQIIYPDERIISLADLPGIIEGAHVNVGLGHHFLKHLERTKIHLFVIDLYGFKLNSKRLKNTYRSPLETILLLIQELEKFNSSLVSKPAICVLNKIDKREGDLIADVVMEYLAQDRLHECFTEDVCPTTMVHFDKVIPISANSGQGIQELKSSIRELLDKVALIKSEEVIDLDRLDKEFEEQMHSLV